MHHARSSRATLALVSIVSFMIAFDAMVVATALVPIRAELQAPIERLQWTLSAYNLTFALLLLPGAILGDRFGRRRLLLLGLALFVASSVACAAAGSPSPARPAGRWPPTLSAAPPRRSARAAPTWRPARPHTGSSARASRS